MKNMKQITWCVILFIISLITSIQLSAQPIDSSSAYFPMHVGDKWEYDGDKMSEARYSVFIEITGDTVAPNGFKYMIFKERNTLSGTTVYWKRLDSISGSIYELSSQGSETQEDSLRAMPGDSFIWYSYYRKHCMGMRIDTILKLRTTVKSIAGLLFNPNYNLALGLGLCYWSLDDGYSVGLNTRNLIYAKINGAEYGTPSLVTAEVVTPKRYILNQNYPNPFNPSTTIEFFLPKRSFVKLTIINSIGQKVSEWIYSYKQAGQHSIRWSPQSSSGVYFYKLETISLAQPFERYSETRKMLFLK